jgi:hypothetical protein
MVVGIQVDGRLIAALAVMATLIALVGSRCADAAVYWGSSVDGVGAANLDGSNPIWDYMYSPGVSEMQGPACGVVIGTEYLYWAAPGSIVRRKLEGEGFYPAAIVPHLDSPCGLTADGSHLYWTYSGGHPPTVAGAGSIGRANFDGSEVTTNFITGLERPCGIAVEGGHVFWVGRGPLFGSGIGRANLDGSGAQSTFIPAAAAVLGCGIAASGGHLYWGQGNAIARANLEGGELDPNFIPGTGLVEAIAIGAGHIYWASETQGSMGRANLDGSEANSAWLPTGERELDGIAVDEGSTPPFLTLPSRSIEPDTKVEYNVRSGAVRFGVYVPPEGPLARPSPPQGELRVTSPGLSWAVLPGSVASATHGGAYDWQVRVRSGSGAVGRRIRTQLRLRGEARATVQLSYSAPRAYPVEGTMTLTLRRYPGAAAVWTNHPHLPKIKPKPKRSGKHSARAK